MIKLVLWGMGTDYDRAYNILSYERLKGNIDIIALVDNKNSVYNTIDGIPIISVDSLKKIHYDYICILPSRHFEEILEQVQRLGIKRQYIIDASVLFFPHMDIKKYICIKENPISIISDDCWGALAYSLLGLEFASPFINTRIEPEDYLKMTSDLNYYLSQQLVVEGGGLGGYPLGKLGNGRKCIKIHFYHDLETDILSTWERRKKRFNEKNIFVKATIEKEEDIEKFHNLPYPKVGFWYKPCHYEEILYLEEWQDPQIRKSCDYNFKKYVRQMVEKSHRGSRIYNVFDLLYGDKYMRMQSL